MSATLSIVTICYKNFEGVKKTIDSLMTQTSYDFEQWVIDGGSTDGTYEYLRDLQVPWRLKWLSERDSGIYDAMNKGTSRCKGDFVWYLNSGDIAADPGVIDYLLHQAALHADAALIYGKVIFDSKYGRRSVGRKVSGRDFATSMPVSHPGMVFNRSHLSSSPYSTKYRIVSDWILVRSLLAKSVSTVFMDREIAIFNVEGVSSTEHWQDLREKLHYVGALKDRLKILLFCGGRYTLIAMLKLFGVYSLIKRYQWARKRTY